MSLYKSYSLKKITDILDKEDISYDIVQGCYDIGFCTTGCRITFEGSDFCLSVQTHPSITNEYFCESCLQTNKGVVYCDSLGYDSTVLFHEPSEFHKHIVELKNLIGNSKSESFKDCEVRQW